MTWIAPNAPEPPDGPSSGPDRPNIEAYLNYQRCTLLNICAGLNAEQLASRPIASTNLSLLGLVRHMAKVERVWFRIRASGEQVEMLFDTELGDDTDFNDADAATAERDFAIYAHEVAAAKEAAALIDFDAPVPTRAEPWSFRMVHLHMIGEYARHNGHADLLREAIDGVTDR